MNYANLEDILKSKKGNFWELASPALEVGVNSLGTRRVLQMVGHLHHVQQWFSMYTHTHVCTNSDFDSLNRSIITHLA